mgnify:CR=1 FL=1
MNTIQKATTHMGSAAAWMKNITKDMGIDVANEKIQATLKIF